MVGSSGSCCNPLGLLVPVAATGVRPKTAKAQTDRDPSVVNSKQRRMPDAKEIAKR
jgi:hypothetical protein